MIWGTYYHKYAQNIEFFKILCTKYMASSEAMTSSTRSFAYSYQLVKKCFVKIWETSKCHNFLIFQPIFIRFSLFCSQTFTLFSEIKFRSSPLTIITVCGYVHFLCLNLLRLIPDFSDVILRIVKPLKVCSSFMLQIE